MCVCFFSPSAPSSLIFFFFPPRFQCIDISGNDYGSKGAGVILSGLAKNAMLQEVYLGGLEARRQEIVVLFLFFVFFPPTHPMQ